MVSDEHGSAALPASSHGTHRVQVSSAAALQIVQAKVSALISFLSAIGHGSSELCSPYVLRTWQSCSLALSNVAFKMAARQ